MKTPRQPLRKLTKAYLSKFFRNKNLPFQEWQITTDGVTCTVNNYAVIELIMNASHEEQRQLADALCELNSQNRDINLFLKHLAFESSSFSQAQIHRRSTAESLLKTG